MDVGAGFEAETGEKLLFGKDGDGVTELLESPAAAEPGGELAVLAQRSGFLADDEESGVAGDGGRDVPAAGPDQLAGFAPARPR